MINMIAAISTSNQLGYRNELLVHMPADLAHFKQLTEGSICIQGRKTYQSIVDKLGKPLPGRTNIVLTRDKKFDPKFPNVYTYSSIESVLHEYNFYGDGQVDVFVIGGQTIYEQMLPYADRIYLTIIKNIFPKADAHFSKLSDEWVEVSKEEHEADDKNPYNYNFVTFEHRQK